MSNQQEDYVLDAPYTWSFFNEQSPMQLSWVAHINGIDSPDIQQPFHYCELGSGNGLTCNLLAAAFPQGEFYAVDFNPEHTKNGSALQSQGRLENAHHLNLDFKSFIDTETPAFDFITLHGVYSWVSKAVREEVVDVLAQKLKPNGLVYLCYSAMPGWAELMPFWHMMMRFADSREGSTVERAEKALQYLKFLRDNEAPYFLHTPYASRYLDKILKRDPHYLVHDLFNKSFAPPYFSEVAEDFQRADLRYLGDAHTFRNYRSLTLLPQFNEYINATPDSTEAEVRKSLVMNDFFRRDVFHKGRGRPSGHIETPHAVYQHYVGQPYPFLKLSQDVSVGLQSYAINDPLSQQCMQLAWTGQYRISELMQHTDLAAHSSEQIWNALLILLCAEVITPIAQPCQQGKLPEDCYYAIANPMNQTVLTERHLKDGKCYIASARLGSAVRLNFLQGIFLMALEVGSEEDSLTTAKSLIMSAPQHWPKDIVVDDKQHLDDEWLKGKWREFIAQWLVFLYRYEFIFPRPAQ